MMTTEQQAKIITLMRQGWRCAGFGEMIKNGTSILVMPDGTIRY